MVVSPWRPGRPNKPACIGANTLPASLSPKPGDCVHGHFNLGKGFGLIEYYPDADQVITVLRDPLEAALSHYFDWKLNGRKRQLELSLITEGGITTIATLMTSSVKDLFATCSISCPAR